MKIINICGTVNTGKTTICNILRDRILKAKGKSLTNNQTNSLDFTDIFEVKGKYIGIASSGDTALIVDASNKQINRLAKENKIELDYLFLTSRTKGQNSKTADAILGINNDNAYTFMTNKIQQTDKNLQQQKSLFLDYILSVTDVFLLNTLKS